MLVLRLGFRTRALSPAGLSAPGGQNRRIGFPLESWNRERRYTRHRDMTRRRSRAGAAVLACLTITATGCTAGTSLHPAPTASPHGKPQAVADASLTAFHSCSDALAGLRGAAETSVTAYGMPTVAGASSSRTGAAYAAAGVPWGYVHE